ncbi:hypothetical protein [Rickettsiella endosymbiont of Miltochrista miniata]|uniref:hypothetical protein n=1 Tax=Rickettsiella endosymbiont of Miltochrista miniata TaxID=3066239 RepID=UPI00313C180C
MIQTKDKYFLSMQKKTYEIAARLQIARIARGYRSRLAFVRQFNFKLGTYNAHEIGRHKIGTNYICQYCIALNISITWLLLGRGNPIDYSPRKELEKGIEKHFEWLTYLSETGKLLFS